MVNKPLTIEYCVKKLHKAILKKNVEEVEKWDYCIKSLVEFDNKIRINIYRKIEEEMQKKLIESYRL